MAAPGWRQLAAGGWLGQGLALDRHAACCPRRVHRRRCPPLACARLPPRPQMSDGAELTAVPESADRLQQARELGPLFASVFGPGAASGLKQEPL